MNHELRAELLEHGDKSFMALTEPIKGVAVIAPTQQLMRRLRNENLLGAEVYVLGVEVENHKGVPTSINNLDNDTVVLVSCVKDEGLTRKMRLAILHKAGSSLINLIRENFPLHEKAKAV